MEHKCTKEATIAKMQVTIEQLQISQNDIKSNIYNMIVSITKLSENVKELSQNSRDMTTAISGLLQFQYEIVGVEKQKDKYDGAKSWILPLVISAFFGIIGILIAIYIK